MGVATLTLPTGVYHDYTGQVDFRLSAKPGIKWRVWTLLKIKDDVAFSTGLGERKLFNQFHLNLHTLNSNSRMMVEFIPQAYESEDEASEARRKLLAYLTKKHLPIIWKEGKHGYQIDRTGRILNGRKWRLNSTYRIPTRPMD